jgi:hypothetical protein
MKDEWPVWDVMRGVIGLVQSKVDMDPGCLIIFHDLNLTFFFF